MNPIGLILALSLLSVNSLQAGDASETRSKLRCVADAVVKNATFKFVDTKSGERFAKPEQAPLSAELQPESPYTDWRYWNGVLNIAMTRLGETLHDSTYTKFARANVAFSFDNYQYFEKVYKSQGKWEYPFGQRFVMEELDDCGAMGASVIEVNRLNPQERYRTYIDQAATHMLLKQTRLQDGTFVRSFPHKWTLWADDLYMSVSFLARMGEFSGDRRYFDDAARQVCDPVQ